MRELPLQKLHERLNYDANTGVFTWKISVTPSVKVGDIAGSNNGKGYITIGIDGKDTRAHRIAYAMVTGKSSFGELDHIDGNRANNAISNLREVSHIVNLQNKIGKGYWKRKNKWQAEICTNGKTKCIGQFDTEEEAHKAYLAAKQIYHADAMQRN